MVQSDFSSAGSWCGETTGEFGDLEVSDNTIATNETDSYGICVSDIGNCNDFTDAASLTIGETRIEQNDVTADATGLYVNFSEVKELNDGFSVTMDGLSW